MKTMRYVFSLFAVLLLTCEALMAKGPLLDKLQQIKEISDIKEMDVAQFSEYYDFLFEQPLDHMNPAKGTFKQRVLLGHRDFKAPMVAILEGYGIFTAMEGELSWFLSANQLTVEHRFFKNSRPAGDTPWEYLTLKQAATDHHKIIQALRKYVYTDNCWITTGISKGGQTTVYHRYFYPNDVEISVPYVAPLNLAQVDPRYEKFISKLGKAPKGKKHQEGNGKDIKSQVFDFQIKCFENLNKIMPYMEASAALNRHTFEKEGGTERALKMMILDFPFAFWQAGGDISIMPEPESENFQRIFDYLAYVAKPGNICDQMFTDLQAYYYCAMTESGQYDYNIKPFKKYFKEERRNRIQVDFVMPKGYEHIPFNKKQLKDINHWLQTDAEKMLFLYGGIDSWSSTAVNLKKNDKCVKFVLAGAGHGCRILRFDKPTQTTIMRTIHAWIKGIPVEEEKYVLQY